MNCDFTFLALCTFFSEGLRHKGGWEKRKLTHKHRAWQNNLILWLRQAWLILAQGRTLSQNGQNAGATGLLHLTGDPIEHKWPQARQYTVQEGRSLALRALSFTGGRWQATHSAIFRRMWLRGRIKIPFPFLQKPSMGPLRALTPLRGLKGPLRALQGT